jgi:hypothetical protein
MSAPLPHPHRPGSLVRRARALLLAALRGLVVIVVGVVAAAIVFLAATQLGLIW